jgi:hypothetical protein
MAGRLLCWFVGYSLAGPKDITFGKDGIQELLSRQQKY